MARLTHRQSVAERVGTAGRNPVGLPFPAQHRVTAARVVGASLHPALALSSGPIEKVISEGHKKSPPLRPLGGEPPLAVGQLGNLFQRPDMIRDPCFHSGRDPEALVDAAEVVVEEMQCYGMRVMVQLL